MSALREWDDPEETAFEAALGRFVLAFATLEQEVAAALAAEMLRLGRRNPLDPNAALSQRLIALDLLQASTRSEALRTAPLDQVRNLARHRNVLVHGQWDGGAPADAVRSREDKKRAYPAERLDRLAVEAEDLADRLRVLS